MSKKRILILDDEPDLGALVQHVAERLGYEATVLADSAQFKSTYERVRPNVIVLDIVMPGIDGIELTRWLMDIGNKAKVVLVTGFDPLYARSAEVLATAMGQFPITSLNKPVSLEHLTAALEISEKVSAPDEGPSNPD